MLPLLDVGGARRGAEAAIEATPQELQMAGERRSQGRPSKELEQRPAVHVVLVIGNVPR